MTNSQESLDSNTHQRKLDHLQVIQSDPEVDRQLGAFDRISLRHRALSELSYNDISTQTHLLGYQLSQPLIISSMTGGSGRDLTSINQRLARGAQAQRIAMAVGSMRPLLSDFEASRQSFDLRPLAPDVPLLANLGAAQLCSGNQHATLDQIRACIDLLNADALIIHFNRLQELIQPEGDRDFRGLYRALERLVKVLDVPLIAKEVGCGMSREDFQRLAELGVTYVDVAGRGGTSWSRIEYHRRSDPSDRLGLLFQDWGVTTPDALLMARCVHEELTLIASGGIRSGLDSCKALAMGASYVGIARPFLEAALESVDAVIALAESHHRELKAAMFLSGVLTLSELTSRHDLWFYEGGAL